MTNRTCALFSPTTTPHITTTDALAACRRAHMTACHTAHHDHPTTQSGYMAPRRKDPDMPNHDLHRADHKVKDDLPTASESISAPPTNLIADLADRLRKEDKVRKGRDVLAENPMGKTSAAFGR